MKFLKISSVIFLIVLIIASFSVTALITKEHSANEGSVNGTGFVIQELNGAGSVRYDVDDNGNLYFAVTSPDLDAIVIYNNKGEYKHTLLVRAAGSLGVKIDEDNNILAYDVRGETVTYYNSKGVEIKSILVDYSVGDTFPWRGNENVRERNGIRYVNIHGTITKYDDGTESIVFTIPVWQRWYRAFNLVMILSIVALFLRLAIPKWIKAFKNRYGSGA